MKKSQFRMRKNSGFSLGELLATVAILVILMAAAMPAVVSIQKNLRQKELDAKAEIIYVAAQNAISKLKAGGNTEVYQAGADGVWRLAETPSDADSEKDNINDGDIYYFTSVDIGPAVSAIMNSDTVDEALLNNHWVVEYNPSSAIIYAVFYSEDRVDCAGEYKAEYGKYDLLRPKEARLADGANVGYYGGGSAAASSTVTTMTPTLTITNTEKLAANISCVLPTSISDYPVFKVDLKDSKGNTYTKYYAYADCSLTYKQQIENAAGSDEIDYTLMKRSGRVFKLELILDDLSSESARFVNAYGKGSSHSVKLEAGTALTVTVTAMCPGNYKYTQNLSDSKTTNSLFANESTGDKAVISYARHLQNLDESSGVVAAITNAEQSGDITFTDVLPAVSSDQYIDWYETYNKGYFNGLTDGVPNFRPIQNSNLQSYDGTLKRISKLTVSAESDAGLFEKLSGGQTVKNVVLAGTKVSSANASAGALVGNVTGNAVIKQCQAYLTTPDIKGKDNHDVWIQGNTAGGLIGTVTGGGVAVKTSAASTVVGGHAYYAGAVQSYDSNSVGGLIGSVASGSVTIEESYADCYLFGKTVGGLVGTSHGAVTLTSCYAAGFETFETKGAGLVCGAAEMTEAYTIMYRIDVESTKPYSGTAESGTATDVYYLAASTSDKEPTIGSPISSMDVSALTSGSNAVFTSNTATAQPYYLMGQALTAYQYPVLNAVKHYGDWMADFQEGTLVYYEEYRDGYGKHTYGFFGANVTSTLKDDADLTVVGDGYGIVYQDGAGNLPEQVAVTVSTSPESKETLTVKGGSSYPVTGTDGVNYKIYPLSTELVNTEKASDKYYLKAEITSAGKTDTYYFNPHFAKTVVGPLADASAPAPVLTTDSNIAVRTPRHLYMMSLYYDTYAEATKGCTFAQERNIDYADYLWKKYSTKTDADQPSQAPIAGGETAFQATYDGGCHWITNVNFTTKTGLYVGFIGRNAGTIKNVVLTATYDEGRDDNYHVRRSGNIENNRAVYMGVLAGINSGMISNCAVAGYYIAGSDGTIHAYENSYLYAGGLVGENTGTITNCSADTPALRLSSIYARAYLGGFVGNNSNYIYNCYALGHIEVAFAKGGRVSIAGFAGRNSARIQNSYCATALTSSGDSTASYGFAPAGGRVQSCDYLNNGTYTYVHHMYPFNFDPCDGTSTTFLELKANGVGERPVNSYNFQNTKTVSEQYPFRAVVRDGSGNLVHYGDWLDDENMGAVGIFYWEHEEGGSNNGYHFTYLGTENGKNTGGTTLCNAHDDGGVITEYGYGYFELNKGSVTSLTLEDATINGSATFDSKTNTQYNQAASEALEKQMHKTLADGEETSYYFYAFTTRTKEEYAEKADGKGYLCLTGTRPNCTWTLKHEMNEMGTTTYKYEVSPFFANAMSCASENNVTAFDGTTTDYQNTPGSETNQYEIRSIQQLQYINWNTQKANYTDTETEGSVGLFPYECATDTDKKYYSQTHDVKNTEETGGEPTRFYPLGRAGRSFKEQYDGNSYQIRNLRIEESSSSYVGLFGELGGGTVLKNVIMTADEGKGSIISRYHAYSGENGYREPVVGALAGMVWVGVGQENKIIIENCASAGYTVKYDGIINNGFYRYVSVGGLVGSLFSGTITNCYADNTVESTNTQTWRQQLGGLVGTAGIATGRDSSSISAIQNCYSGGEIKKPNNSNYLCGGLIGNANGYDQKSDLDQSQKQTTINNCYTYCKVPSSTVTGYNGYNGIHFVAGNYKADATTPTYYYKWDNNTDVGNVGTGLTYTEMSNGTLLEKLGGDKLATGSVTVENAGYHNVTTTEGSANVPIDGKYSYPSNPALEGKNYPFPAVIQQKDLTFGTAENPVYVYVHYGDWPIDGPYWTSGRDSMDIFADMQADGYAAKTFYLNPNGKDLSGIAATWFTCDPDSIAEVVAVGTLNENGLYPVTIRAKNTGTAIIAFTYGSYTAEFSLEVTANIDVQAVPTALKLKENEPGTITLSANSLMDAAHLTLIDYSNDPNTTWKLETVDDDSSTLVELTQMASPNQNKWRVTRHDLGKVTLKAIFTYDYHDAKFTAVAYVDVTQPDTVGLSDGQTQYNVAYLGTDTTGRTTTYSVNKPSVEDAVFFLYLDAETLKMDALTIQSITVGGQAAASTGNVYETAKFYIELDTPASDKNYQYLPGNIYVKGSENAQNVELNVTVSSDGTPCTLTITLPEVKKALSATYQDGAGNSFIKLASAGEHKLPTQSEAKMLNPSFNVPSGEMLEGWTVAGDSTVYLPGSLYNFTADVTFIAKWKNAVVTLDANGGTFDGGAVVEDIYPNETGMVTLSPTPTRSGYAFAGWNTKAEGTTGTAYHAGVEVNVNDLAPEYKLYARWEPYTLTLFYGGEPKVFSDVTGTSLPGYNSSDFNRTDYTLDGWYTEEDSSGNRVKVLDENGKVVAPVSGYSKLDGENLVLELTGNQKLYARWKKPTKYVLTKSLGAGGNYLLVSRNSEGAGKAFAQSVAGTPTYPNCVDVTVKKDPPDYYIEQDMPADAVFQCLDGGKLKNNVGYIKWQSTSSYILDESDGTIWSYSSNRLSYTVVWFGWQLTTSYFYYDNDNVYFGVTDSKSKIYLYKEQPAEYEFSTEAASST